MSWEGEQRGLFLVAVGPTVVGTPYVVAAFDRLSPAVPVSIPSPSGPVSRCPQLPSGSTVSGRPRTHPLRGDSIAEFRR